MNGSRNGSRKENNMNWIISWLAAILPGWKTQIVAWLGAGTGGILLFLDWAEKVDLSSYIPPQYYAIFMMIMGILTSLFRAAGTKAAVTIGPVTAQKVQ